MTDARSSFAAAVCRLCERDANYANLSHGPADNQHAQHDTGRGKHQVGGFRHWLHLFRQRHRSYKQRGIDTAGDSNAKRDDGRRAIAVAGAAAQQQADLPAGNTGCGVPADRALQRPRIADDYNYSAHNNHRKRYGLHLSLWALALLPTPAWGQVNATAAPSSVSNGSVTNMAVQAVGGPWPSYHLGPNQISCQGPTLSINPFVTKSHSYTLPRREYQRTPYYDNLDANEDNVPDNPGDILFWQQTPTGQKDSHALNLGVSLTFSVPLDTSLADRCKALGDTQRKLLEQLLAHKKLDYELGRLKFCGDQALRGVIFRPGSAAAQICSDVVVIPKPDQVLPHKHKTNDQENDAVPLPRDSYLFAPDVVREDLNGESYALANP